MFIARLQLSFSVTKYGYSDRFIKQLYGMAMMVMLSLTIWVGIEVDGEVVHPQRSLDNHSPARNYHVCNTKVPFSFLIFGTLFDIFLSLWCIVLFQRPLRKLFQETDQIDHKAKESAKSNVVSYICITLLFVLV